MKNFVYFQPYQFIIVALMMIGCHSQKAIPSQLEAMTLKEQHAQSFGLYTDGPVDRENIQYVDYFPVDQSWKLVCDCDTTLRIPTITVNTSSGKTKSYQPWAIAKCKRKSQSFDLYIYLQVPRSANPIYKNNFFIPFKDATNGETTYGGGRYIDGKIYEVTNGKVTIDFNHAYNPYCAYSTGYNCPIPPVENHLDISILAGEKAYKGPIKKK